jgi:hypothetical protein
MLMVVQILCLRTRLIRIHYYIIPLLVQRIIQTAFQIYLLKVDVKAHKILWIIKYVFSVGCYAWLYTY